MKRLLLTFTFLGLAGWFDEVASGGV